MATALDSRPGTAGGPTPAAPPERGAPRASRVAALWPATRRVLRQLRPDSTRKRVWTLTGTALVALAGLFAVASVATAQARDGLQVIGEGAGPQVVATADLYYALSDMDAQVVNVLLMGNEHNLGDGRDAALELYDQRRSEANTALVRAAQLAAGDSTELRNVQDLLDGLGRYEQLVAEALLLSEDHDHEAGPPPDDVVEVHQDATNLMRLELLPKAYNLTLEQGSVVRATYEDRHAAVVSGAVWTAITGAVTLAALLALQIYLVRRFRRRFNTALAAATVGVILLTVGGTAFLAGEARLLREAKEDGFDSVLALAQARATGISMHSGQARFILAPEYAESYEQVYLENSQALLYVDKVAVGEDERLAEDAVVYEDDAGTRCRAVGNLTDYYVAVEGSVDAYPAPYCGDDMLGFLGDQARDITVDGQEAALREVLGNYTQFQQRDELLRVVVERELVRGGIDFVLGSEGGTARSWFEAYDASVVQLSELHQGAFDGAIARGQGLLPWGTWGVPIAVALIAGLVAVGVWPRVAEYR